MLKKKKSFLAEVTFKVTTESFKESFNELLTSEILNNINLLQRYTCSYCKIHLAKKSSLFLWC